MIFAAVWMCLCVCECCAVALTPTVFTYWCETYAASRCYLYFSLKAESIRWWNRYIVVILFDNCVHLDFASTYPSYYSYRDEFWMCTLHTNTFHSKNTVYRSTWKFVFGFERSDSQNFCFVYLFIVLMSEVKWANFNAPATAHITRTANIKLGVCSTFTLAVLLPHRKCIHQKWEWVRAYCLVAAQPLFEYTYSTARSTHTHPDW